MNEYLSPTNPEHERAVGLEQIIELYLTVDDAEFLVDLEPEDRLGYVYGRLLELGADPDLVLAEFGVTEMEDEV